jgi:aminopeptidase N
MWRRINAALNSNDRFLIHEINRASLMDDMLNLGRVGYLDYDIVFAGTRYLANETAYGPWKAAYNGFSYLTERFVGRPEIYNSYKVRTLNGRCFRTYT